jgi:hypothetical protein
MMVVFTGILKISVHFITYMYIVFTTQTQKVQQKFYHFIINVNLKGYFLAFVFSL